MGRKNRCWTNWRRPPDTSGLLLKRLFRRMHNVRQGIQAWTDGIRLQTAAI